jgi:4-carboxymuconolactone decarboxylase
MSDTAADLGGRLPILHRKDLSPSQRAAYELVDRQFVPWAEASNFESKTPDGGLIGPFNSVLYSPELSSAFLAWQTAEEKHTSLDPRVRQVTILAVGALWKADYELYAHAAVGRKAGLSERTISQF